MLNRIRGPFNINLPALRAGVAAVEDQSFVDAAVAHNTKWLNWLSTEIAKLGYKVTPSVGNFLLIHFNTAEQAKAADDFLSSHGLILRAVSSYGLPAALRLSVGTEEANHAVVASLKEFCS